MRAELAAGSIPLFAADAARTVAYFRGAPVMQTQMQEAALRLAASLPEAAYVVNLCANRYLFLLAWIAACLRGQIVLLPPDRSAGTLANLAAAYPDLHTLDDATTVQRLDGCNRTLAHDGALPADRVVALAFTSGSTGRPQPHPKLWRTLACNAQLAARRVLGGAGAHVVATVPPQHAYGLETSVIAALTGGCVLLDGQPFFPQDVRVALEAAPAPRTLVTTPLHLQALLAAQTSAPPLQGVVSATAPLARELAVEIERRWRTVVHEIYGCTEAGVVAWRRTTASSLWRVFDGGRIWNDATGARYDAPQLAHEVELQDVVEPLSETEFQLRGRADDMIKVAGKRASLAGLTEQLRSIAGVVDAVVFAPTDNARPAALVVAPGLRAQQIASALNERIDPAFTPRPLLCVAELPRNPLGKLPREALLRALATGGENS